MMLKKRKRSDSMSAFYKFHGSSLVAQLANNLPAMQEALKFDPWVGKIFWRRNRLPSPVFLGFPGGSDIKESALLYGRSGSIPKLVRVPRRRSSYLLHYRASLVAQSVKICFQ